MCNFKVFFTRSKLRKILIGQHGIFKGFYSLFCSTIELFCAMKKLKIAGIIPARFGSSRFPGKPLVDINGKTMIRRVYEQAKKCKELDEVVVATDDERIFNHVLDFGGRVIMTATSHKSGTHRCHEALQKIGGSYDVVLNIQGDEPFIQPKLFDDLASCFYDPQTLIASIIKKINTLEELNNPNVVKVALKNQKQAIYFSRSAIPYIMGKPKEEWLENHVYYKHIGVYGFRPSVLNLIVQFQPTPLETAESLEQMRWIEYGYRIKMIETKFESIAIDTPEDLKKINFL